MNYFLKQILPLISTVLSLFAIFCFYLFIQKSYFNPIIFLLHTSMLFYIKHVKTLILILFYHNQKQGFSILYLNFKLFFYCSFAISSLFLNDTINIFSVLYAKFYTILLLFYLIFHNSLTILLLFCRILFAFSTIFYVFYVYLKCIFMYQFPSRIILLLFYRVF